MADRLARTFGTEEDKVNCPFYHKIGACRHGDRCGRLHNKPLFSLTIELAHAYVNPSAALVGAGGRLTPAQEAAIRKDFENFYIDIFDEAAKFGTVEEVHVCDNLADHLVGNVYVKYSDEEEAAAAIAGLRGRYYNGRAVAAEYCPVTDFHNARCKQADDNNCSRGGYCNYMHLKRPDPEMLEELLRSQPRPPARINLGIYAPRGAGGGLLANEYTVHDGDEMTLYRKQRGLSVPLNWSLASDGLTTRGEAYRNAPVRELLEFAGPRAEVAVDAARAATVLAGPLAAAVPTAAFATDVMPGRKVMDVDEYEARLESLRSEVLSYAPRLFVEDGAVGVTRASELRVRVVTDSALVALFFRSLLVRIPLYAPEVFPRTLTVYAATLAREGVAAWGAGGGGPFTVVDVDAAAARGTVAAAGAASLPALQSAVGAAASALMAAGGYRAVPGGAHNPNLAEARRDGVLHWYVRDGHVYADKAEAHPDLLAFAGAVVAGPGGPVALPGAGPALAAAAAAKGRLLAAGGAVWGAVAGAPAAPGAPAPPHALAALWAGGLFPAGAGAGAGAGGGALPRGRGALTAQGLVALPLEAPGAHFGAPARVLVVGGAGADAAAKFVDAGGLAAKAAAKVGARLAGVKDVGAVADDAAAAAALGL